jgi:hypothetical protein
MKWIDHARQHYTLSVPKRVGKASKTRKHFLHSVVANISSPLNSRKSSFLID